MTKDFHTISAAWGKLHTSLRFLSFPFLPSHPLEFIQTKFSMKRSCCCLQLNIFIGELVVIEWDKYIIRLPDFITKQSWRAWLQYCIIKGGYRIIDDEVAKLACIENYVKIMCIVYTTKWRMMMMMRWKNLSFCLSVKTNHLHESWGTVDTCYHGNCHVVCVTDCKSFQLLPSSPIPPIHIHHCLILFTSLPPLLPIKDSPMYSQVYIETLRWLSLGVGMPFIPPLKFSGDHNFWGELPNLNNWNEWYGYISVHFVLLNCSLTLLKVYIFFCYFFSWLIEEMNNRQKNRLIYFRFR